MSDVALLAAKAWLTDWVCECGHLDIEHEIGRPALGRHCYECDCYFWRPVSFTLKRAGAERRPCEVGYVRPRRVRA